MITRIYGSVKSAFYCKYHVNHIIPWRSSIERGVEYIAPLKYKFTRGYGNIETDDAHILTYPGSQTEIIWENYVNIVVANALPPCVASTSTVMTLNVQDKRFGFNEEKFNYP